MSGELDSLIPAVVAPALNPRARVNAPGVESAAALVETTHEIETLHGRARCALAEIVQRRDRNDLAGYRVDIRINKASVAAERVFRAGPARCHMHERVPFIEILVARGELRPCG